MKIYAERSEYKCALISSDEWQIYRDLRASYFIDEKQYDLAQQELDIPESEWRRYLTEGPAVLVLFQNEKAIGHVKVFDPPSHWKKPPELNWMHIERQYRGQKLSDLLYEAAFKFLATTTMHRKCFGRIYYTAAESFRAATRNGMSHTRTQHPQSKYDDPGDYYIVEKDLRPLREP